MFGLGLDGGESSVGVEVDIGLFFDSTGIEKLD